ncbi:hypothetical protein SEA_TOMAS_154 [Streptomyces phage Tomas]|uniref:Uncharacterized protein n=1 Tax=Streptomyces phage Tomas TaxID=2914443 RepID=A0AA49H3R2_9CAUD|nr:hypothetical protein PP453_gp145 [Streptomyces phage Tomas]UMO76322.1 hypothetical protein SEA_TOMAS_154 [Streptomyces phage Tomas]
MTRTQLIAKLGQEAQAAMREFKKTKSDEARVEYREKQLFIAQLRSLTSLD